LISPSVLTRNGCDCCVFLLVRVAFHIASLSPIQKKKLYAALHQSVMSGVEAATQASFGSPGEAPCVGDFPIEVIPSPLNPGACSGLQGYQPLSHLGAGGRYLGAANPGHMGGDIWEQKNRKYTRKIQEKLFAHLKVQL
jgi:hypothetical protein